MDTVKIEGKTYIVMTPKELEFQIQYGYMACEYDQKIKNDKR